MPDKKKKLVIVPYPINGFLPSATDPSGSYTGIPVEQFEDPIQDVDDL